MKALIDTCVIIDSLQNRQPFSEAANKILMAVANRRVDGYITAKSITDIYYLTHRCTHSDSKTREIIGKLMMLYGVLDTTAMDCRQAAASEVSDFEDAVMMQTAVRSGIDCIVTRNVKDYTKSPVKVYDPESFVRVMEESQ